MTRTILLADDSVTIQKVVELTFLDEDFEVVAVSNGTQAMAKLDEVSPDLVIADVHMPGASGFEVCRRSKQQLPRVPVLLLVGTFEPFDPAESTAAGADEYLKKPFDSQELLRRAKELIARGGSSAIPAAAAPLPEPAVEGELLSWDGDSFTLEGDGSTLIEPPAEIALPAAPALAFPAESSAVAEDATLLLPRAVSAPAPVAPPSFELEPAPVVEVQPPRSAPQAVAAPGPEVRLTDADIERIARRVVDLLAPQILREVAWEVVPDLAEVEIRARIRELEAELE